MVEAGEKKFRGGQVFKWLYQKGAESFAEMTDLSLPLRDRLNEMATIGTPKPGSVLRSEEGDDVTQKILFELADGKRVESVYIPDGERATICVSSQVGCAIDCKFCATGKMGFVRNLSVGEMIYQVVYMRKHIREEISNVVFMGMGEPMLNYDRVMAAATIMTSARGPAISAKRITISTSGIVPKIRQFADDGWKFSLALSLNATTDVVRSRIMPITRKYPIEELIQASRHYLASTKKRITLEYVLLAGVNDSLKDADRLTRIAERLGNCKINIIPYNPIKGEDFRRPDDDSIDRFLARISNYQIVLTLRKSRGDDIAAACGQLIVSA